jgi:uncharacterized protein YdaU (DUF1376 family)
MSAAEVGAYIRLLCHQWHQGAVPADPVKLERITGLKCSKLDEVLTKFEKKDDQTFVNSRLEKTRGTIEEFRRKQAVNGGKGGRPAKPSLSKTETQKNPGLSFGLSLANPNESSHTHSHTHSQDTAKAVPPNPQGGTVEVSDFKIRVASWFRRKPTTAWSQKEEKAWKVIKIDTEDFRTLENYYTMDFPDGADFRRRDLQTLLNNWNSEIDRARPYDTSPISRVELPPEPTSEDFFATFTANKALRDAEELALEQPPTQEELEAGEWN